MQGLFLLKICYPRLITHYSLFIVHYSLFIIHYSLFTIHYSLFIIHHSRFPTQDSMDTYSFRHSPGKFLPHEQAH
jgi:hypothetical protein